MDFQAQGAAETSKRLLSQLVNEGLINLTPIKPDDSSRWRGENCVSSETGRWVEVSMANTINLDGRSSRPVWRPNNFVVPVILRNGSNRIIENDPGSIFEFLGPWDTSVDEAEEQIVIELRNSAAIAGKPTLLIAI
ncbi:hypothetical protein TWF694_008249 [Orbilia ellipsospora]|uniref:Uncharacterized protein n=1 Tax=Orbilia ellipsospora TaxID=2528407 RepID=A0AAV9XGS5_9PEZI